MLTHVTPHVFIAAAVALATVYSWPLRWCISGAPLLTYCFLLGEAGQSRVLQFIPLWIAVVLLNLSYAVASTSWLLYGAFLPACYSFIFFTCLYQFNFAATAARKCLRSLITQLHFVNDQIAFFDLPALEIDTEVDGLMVIRGISISLSTLTITAHGVEVGIKLSDNMELALNTDLVTIRLFRQIEISDVYGNLKGGDYEMTFGKLAAKTRDADGDAIMNTGTPLLQAAAAAGDAHSFKSLKMTSQMTDGLEPQAVDPKVGLQSVQKLSTKNDRASAQLKENFDRIEKTSSASQCRDFIKQMVNGLDTSDTRKDLRAAICSRLHGMSTCPHPPLRSIRVTTLQHLAPAYIRRFLHRLPMLLRLLLNPISYFHPISITSITATASGKWLRSTMQAKLFQAYGDDNSDIRELEARINAWIADANFALELVNIEATAQVPFMTAYNIFCSLSFGDIMAYRTLPKELDWRQVVRLGGADASVTVPSFLLPHHEHLLPPKMTKDDEKKLQKDIEKADGRPKTILAKRALEQSQADETNVKIGVHGCLPAVLDQELLDIVAALVKATKLVEMEKDPNALDEEVHKFTDFTKALHSSMKEGIKKATAATVVNDKWIAKMIGKITRKLEQAQGDLGYQGDIPVKMKWYRDNAENATKILP